MSDVFETKAKKIAPDQVEVIDANGTHIAGKEEQPTNPFGGAFGGNGVHVMKVGSFGGLGTFLLLPILIPVAIIGFFLLAILALLFGKTFFKAGMAKIIRR